MYYYLFIIVLILIVFLYIVSIFWYPSLGSHLKRNRHNINWITLEDAYQTIDNGDLIFMSGNTRGENQCCFFTESMYSHVGMLFRETNESGENVIYIWESDLGQNMKEGPRIIPLKKKLDLFSGQKYICIRKLKSKRPSTRDILDIVSKYENYGFDLSMRNWWISETCFYNLFKSEKTMLCSELVSQTMKGLGMIGNKYSTSWYSPESFRNHIIPDGKCRYGLFQYVEIN